MVPPGTQLERPPPAATPAPRAGGAARRLAAAFTGSVLGKGFLSVLDQAAVSGTSFVTSVIVGRLGSQEELGVYYLALSLVLFLRGVQNELVSTPYLIYCNRRRGQALAAYAGSALVHHLLLTALGTALLLVLAGLFSLGLGPATLGPAVWVLAGALPFLLLREYFRQLAIAHLRMTAVILIDLTVAVLQVGGLLLLASTQTLGVSTVYAVMGAACAAACVGWLVAGKQPLHLERAQIAPDWWHNWTFGKWTLASFLVGSTTPYILPWALALAHGEAATGLLAACQTLVNLSGTYVTGVANFLTPKAAAAFAEGGLEALCGVLWKTAALFLATLGAFCLAVLAAGDLPATLVYGGRFAGAGPVLSVLAVNVLVNSLGITAGNGLWAIHRPAANFAADVCTLTVTVGLVLCLAPPFGVPGAAVATLAGTTVGATVRGLTLRRLLNTMRHDSKAV